MKKVVKRIVNIIIDIIVILILAVSVLIVTLSLTSKSSGSPIFSALRPSAFCQVQWRTQST
mgnify:FL=1